jgi:hypothetical protein
MTEVKRKTVRNVKDKGQNTDNEGRKEGKKAVGR